MLTGVRREQAGKPHIQDGCLCMHYAVYMSPRDEEPTYYETRVARLGEKGAISIHYEHKHVMFFSRRQAIDAFLGQGKHVRPTATRAMVKGELAASRIGERLEVVREEELPPTPPASSIRLPTMTGRRGFIRLGREV